MRFDNVELARGIWTKAGSTTKQKATHIVPLSAPVKQLLARLRQETNSPWVFPADSKPGHRVTVQKSWLAICKSARIAGLRIHDLRHSFASQLVSQGASLPLIGSLLGHSNPATTARRSHDMARSASSSARSFAPGVLAFSRSAAAVTAR